MPILTTNLTGRGLTFNGNKITTEWAEDSGVEKRENGLYLKDVKAAAGVSEEVPKIDNWSIVEYNGSGTIKTNKDVVQYIYAFSKYPVVEESRESMSLKFDTENEKTKRDVIAEINWLHNNGYPQRSQCLPKDGDLIMFKGVGVPLNIKELYGDLVNATCEDGLRYPDSTCEALFLVSHVSYSGENQQLPLLDMDMQCIWASETCKIKAGQYLSENTTDESTTTDEKVDTQQKETEVIREDPLLTSVLEKGNFTTNDIGNSTQLVVVQSSGTNCTVQLLEKSGDVWKSVYSTSGVVGKQGVSVNAREGSMYTPRGAFGLGPAFGTHTASEVRGNNASMDAEHYKQTNSNSYWCDDPNSSYYNQYVETANPSWSTRSEHLSEYPTSYEYAIFIRYNVNPVVPGNGSAFFLHVSSSTYTAGCVGVPQAAMQKIFGWINFSKYPKILIS